MSTTPHDECKLNTFTLLLALFWSLPTLYENSNVHQLVANVLCLAFVDGQTVCSGLIRAFMLKTEEENKVGVVSNQSNRENIFS